MTLLCSPIFTEEYPLALGKAVSKKNREGLQLQVQSLVYGETEFHTVGTFLEKIKTVYGRPDQVAVSSVSHSHSFGCPALGMTRYSILSLS